MLVGKEAGVGVGNTHQPWSLQRGRCLQRDRKPGQGSRCSSFSVIPSYAKLASASWQVGSWPWLDKPITDPCPVRNVAGGRGRRGQSLSLYSLGLT